MKKLIYIAVLGVLPILSLQAQEKIEKTKTVETTVKSSLGTETVTKKVKTTEITPTKLDPSESGMENQTLVSGNTMIKKEVTYTYNDSDFRLTQTDTGYKIMRTRDNNTSEYGTMLKLSKDDVYMLKTDNGISVSYFDDNGNMVSEQFNDEDDSVTITTYKAKSSDMGDKK